MHSQRTLLEDEGDGPQGPLPLRQLELGEAAYLPRSSHMGAEAEGQGVAGDLHHPELL